MPIIICEPFALNFNYHCKINLNVPASIVQKLRMFDSDSNDGTSSLTFSSLLNKSKDVAMVDAVVKEVKELESQVTELDDLLKALKAESEEKRRRYANEIKDLRKRLDLMKARGESEMRTLKEAQETEYQNFIAEQEEQVAELVHGGSRVDTAAKQWQNMAKGINKLEADSEINKIEEKFNHLESELHNSQILRRSQAIERERERQDKRSDQEYLLRSLHETLLKLAANGRQRVQEYDILIQGAVETQEELMRAHELCMNNMKKEGQKREEIFQKHLAFVKKALDAEKERCEDDRTVAKETLDNLYAVRRETQRRCSQQLQTAQRDIERINKLLEAPDTANDTCRSTMLKSESLQRTNFALSCELKQMENELERIHGKVLTASGELRRAESARTPGKSKTSFSSSLQSSLRY